MCDGLPPSSSLLLFFSFDPYTCAGFLCILLSPIIYVHLYIFIYIHTYTNISIYVYIYMPILLTWAHRARLCAVVTLALDLE